MERFHSSTDIFQEFRVSPIRGFLPATDPLRSLGPAFSAWEETAQNLPHLVANQIIQKQLASLPDFQIAKIKTVAQSERALQILSFIGHAWLLESEKLSVPPLLAQPWSEISQQLQRPPVIAHPSYVLHNWYLSVPEQGITYSNLNVLQEFVGGKDEAAFILLTVMMEQYGAKAVRAIIEGIEAAHQEDFNKLLSCLEMIRDSVLEMTQTFELMRQECQPDAFYADIRPYLSSFNGLVMQGVGKEEAQDYHGGSAAQSSILQSLDAALGLSAPPTRARAFLVKMRDYMPPVHARFVAALEQEQIITKVSKLDSTLAKARQACIEAIVAFRNEHLKIMVEYIIAPAKGKDIMGTGGTHPSRFLKSVRDASKQSE
ncbi:MAG: hypothetical protein AB8H47_24795 [Bacteroidia bacterium]